MTLEAKLGAAEAKMVALRSEMDEIDRTLSSMSKHAPGRDALKATKAEILPRYRGAVQHVKELRRQLNSRPSLSKLMEVMDAAEPNPEVPETVYGQPSWEMCEELYAALVDLDTKDIDISDERIQKFMDWVEGEAE